MTEQDMTRGREIQEEIQTLQISLSQLNKATFFNCDESIRCSGYKGDAFLSELHIKMKKDGVNAISARIKALEKEFSKL